MIINKNISKNDKNILTFNKSGGNICLKIRKTDVTIAFFISKNNMEDTDNIMKNKLTVITKVILDIMFYGGIVITILVPFLYRLAMSFAEEIEENYIPLCVILMICGVFAVLIIGELRKMFKTVINDDCFVMENVTSLKKMGNYSFCIAAATLPRFIIFVNSAVFVVIIVFIIAGLFSKVLAQVFDKAVAYKLENDLTI